MSVLVAPKPGLQGGPWSCLIGTGQVVGGSFRLERPVPWLGRRNRLSDVVARARRRSCDGVAREMSVPGSGLYLGMSRELSDNRKA